MKITALDESADFATLDTEKLFSKLKYHELSRKGHPNHDASLTSKVSVTTTHVGGHAANPTNTTDSSALEFALSSLSAASDEQYESIPDDEIAQLTRMFRALHRFCKERRRSPRGCLLLRSNLEVAAIEIKDLKHKLDHFSRYTILSPPCEACVSLKDKLFHVTKENTELQQKVTYLIAHLEKTILSEKIIEEDLSRVEESTTKSTYRLGVGFER
jgi:hypothetical protein